jgi:hypothetical protein
MRGAHFTRTTTAPVVFLPAGFVTVSVTE